MFVMNVDDAEQHQAIRLPASAIAKPPEKLVRTVFTVHITRPEADGKSYVYFGNRKYLADSDDFKAAIQRERQLLELSKKQPGDPNVIVLLRGDSFARTGEVQRVIEKWQEGNFVNFALRARQEIE
jgi:biopolymer transport protein ExbD